MSTSEPSQISWSSFLGPKHWPTWLGLGILRTLHQLPYSFQLALGRILGRIGQKLLKRREKIARINIDLCFPELTEGQRRKLLRQHFEAIGMGLFESAMTWWGSDDRISSLGTVEGLEHLETAANNNQGVIFLTGHFTTMEMASTMVSIHHRISGMYRRLKNPLMNQVVWRSRNNRSITLFPRDDIPTMIRCLKRGEAVWYGFDQDYGPKHSVFVPFFGIPSATISTTSRFAKMGHAQIIPFFPIRDKHGKYRIRILPPLDNFPSDDLETDCVRLNQILEQAIKEAPEQYLWVHRRFKTRPNNEPSFY